MNNLVKYTWIATLIFLTSCEQKSENKNSIDQNDTLLGIEYTIEEDYKVINSCFTHLLFNVFPDSTKTFGYDNFLSDNYPDSIKREMLLTNCLKGINDTSGFKFSYEEEFDVLRDIKDSSFKSLGEDFLAVSSKNLMLDFSKINNTGLFKLKPVIINEKPKLDIGESYFSFSRIKYNLNKNKACFYFVENCNGLCGSGTFIFLEKINGVWEIKKRLLHWIS